MRIWTVVFVGLLTLFNSCSVAQLSSQPVTTLHQLFLEDQNDMPTQTPRTDPSPEAARAFEDRAAARRAKLHLMLSRGEVRTGRDLYEAAFMFQHGATAQDFLLAHVLACDAVSKGFDRATWLSASTLDRYLQLIGQAQVFGTQYPFDPKLPHPVTNGGRFSGRTQMPFDQDVLPPFIRRDFCVPDLKQQEKNLQTLNAGSYPKDTMTTPGCER